MFEKTHELCFQNQNCLQKGWQMNWAIVKLRKKDFYGAKQLIGSLVQDTEFPLELMKTLFSLDEFAHKKS